MNKVYKGIIELSNTEYHAEKEHLSSSNYKTILESPEKFYEEKILGNRRAVGTSTQSTFDEGTYAHSLLLEPHLVDKEFKFFEGWKKQGKDWIDFQQLNKGFTLLSKPQRVRVEKWAQSAKQHKVAMKLLEGGKPELSLFGELLGVKTKVRADYLNSDLGYLVDVKTTSYSADQQNFKQTMESWKYHLSAALYLLMFEQYFEKPFQFFFLVLSKSEGTCEVFELSQESRMLGESLIRKAADTYKHCLETNTWEGKKTVDKKLELLDDDYEILKV